MKRLSAADYAVDAVTAAKMLLGKWLCRRLPSGSVRKVQIGLVVRLPERIAMRRGEF